MRPSLYIRLVIFWAAWAVTAAPNNGKCFDSDQVQSGDYVPCDPKAEVSSCCVLGDICLSNGLCRATRPGVLTPYFTGLCTDYLWNAPSTCLEICNHNTTRQVAFHDAILSERIIPYSFDRENALLIFDLHLVCRTLKISLLGYTLITRHE